MNGTKRLRWLLRLEPEERLAAIATLSEEEQKELEHHWRLFARPEQLPPGGDWRIWLIMAGRGFGKTRAGAEWVRTLAKRYPDARIALVGGSLGEARAVMVEGESGLLAVSPPGRQPRFEPSLRRVTWPNGAQATLYSAQEPESLRGPQHSHARRAVAKGGLRQRGSQPDRRVASLRHRGRDGHTASHSRRWRKLAGRCLGQR